MLDVRFLVLLRRSVLGRGLHRPRALLVAALRAAGLAAGSAFTLSAPAARGSLLALARLARLDAVAEQPLRVDDALLARLQSDHLAVNDLLRLHLGHLVVAQADDDLAPLLAGRGAAPDLAGTSALGPADDRLDRD